MDLHLEMEGGGRGGKEGTAGGGRGRGNWFRGQEFRNSATILRVSEHAER